MQSACLPRCSQSCRGEYRVISPKSSPFAASSVDGEAASVFAGCGIAVLGCCLEATVVGLAAPFVVFGAQLWSQLPGGAHCCHCSEGEQSVGLSSWPEALSGNFLRKTVKICYSVRPYLCTTFCRLSTCFQLNLWYRYNASKCLYVPISCVQST